MIEVLKEIYYHAGRTGQTLSSYSEIKASELLWNSMKTYFGNAMEWVNTIFIAHWLQKYFYRQSKALFS